METSQWKVRPVSLVLAPRQPLRDPLRIELVPFTDDELAKAIRKMKRGKATKTNDIPPEYFRALALEKGSMWSWMLIFAANVGLAAVFHSSGLYRRWRFCLKKGKPENPENDRPICVQTVACKLFSSMLKNRILDGDASCHLWPSQFGFCKGCGTEDAILIARRIELALARRNGTVKLLALDWRKAFDSLHVGRLSDALRRFGIPRDIVEMISVSLHHRQLVVNDCGHSSSQRPQNSGISQGCTLSPLLFIMVMAILLHDALSKLSPGAQAAYQSGDLADLVYADDTMLLSGSDRHLEEYLWAVQAAGRNYGLELHRGKLQLLAANGSCHIRSPDGQHLETKSAIEYLGTILTEDGAAKN